MNRSLKGLLYSALFLSCAQELPNSPNLNNVADNAASNVRTGTSITFAKGYGFAWRGKSEVKTNDGGYAFTGFWGKDDSYMGLAKIDSRGNLQWEKSYISRSNGNWLRQTPDGGFVLIGNFDYG